MITIIDYNAGNIGSLKNIIKKVGGESISTNNIDLLKKAKKIILPGVGSFDYGMSQLQKFKLIDIIKYKTQVEKTPFLGICLGMQLIANSSEEGDLEGLSLIESKVLKFSNESNKKFKIPHMGWNSVKIIKDNPLIESSVFNKFYFVHSFYFEPKDESHITGTTNYINNFTSYVRKDNIYGVQFHPEKSHKYGMSLIKKFIEL